MDYYKIINRTAQISANKRNIVDLEAEIWSQDLNVTKFVLALETTGPAIDLTNATVRVAMVYSQDGTDVKIEAAGIVEDVATQKITYIMDNRLAGFEGTVTAGFYVTLSTGQRIDIQNVTFNVRKSLIDKDLNVPKENYYQTFDDIVTDVQNTGNTAKTQINQVLPDVQSKVSAINTELAKIDENMPDLFVAYANDINGGGFSKTDSSKLYKGYGVKNSTNTADYRWESNIDNLQIGGRNLLLKSEVSEKHLEFFDTVFADVTIETEGNLKYYKIRKKDGISEKQGTAFLANRDYYNLVKNKHYIFSYWIKSSIDYPFNMSSIGHYQVLNYRDSDVVGDRQHLDTNRKYNVASLTANTWTKVTIEFDTLYDGFFLPFFWFLETGMEICVYGFMLEEGNTPTAGSPAPEDLILNSNPINSILITLSAENPSTTFGGTWVQLGNENKFNQTIYYWQRTQ